MVNTRAKFRKNQSIRDICFREASMVASSSQSTESGALIGSNDDLLTEILCRLPVTSILRFKSVSKHWLSLLSHRHFTHMYNIASTSPGIFVRSLYIPFDDENQSPPFHDLDIYPDRYAIKIIQSCNGLLLCCSSLPRGFYYNLANLHQRRYYVFNPTTKQVAIIPSVIGGRDARRMIKFMGLAFHQTDCVHYKLVCILGAKHEEVYHIQTYSSDVGKWKISDQTFSAPYDTPFSSAVYWNGAIHWAPSCLTPMYFKLDVGELRKLPLPASDASFTGYSHGGMPLYFGESRGHLHLVEKAISESHLHLNVYEMLSDHSGWFVKYQVELDGLPGAYPGMILSYTHRSIINYYKFNVFDVIRCENEEESFMVVNLSRMLIRYYMVDKSFKQISSPNIPELIKPADVHRYIESLASF